MMVTLDTGAGSQGKVQLVAFLSDPGGAYFVKNSFRATVAGRRSRSKGRSTRFFATGIRRKPKCPNPDETFRQHMQEEST
jgi:hypothetical protein